MAGWLTLGLAGCGESSDDTQNHAAVDPVPMFTTQVIKQELVEPISGSGTIVAQKSTDLGPRVDGIIEAVFVKVGDRVAKGDPLFKTRDVDLRLRVTELENQVKLTKAEVRNTARTLSRTRELKKKGVVSSGRLDDAEAAHNVATARVGIAEAQLAAARQDLDDAIVRAPFDGVITRQDVYEGKFMATRMGGGAPGSGGVLQIKKIDVVVAIVEIPEIHLSKIHVGTPGKITIAGTDKSYNSQIDILNDSVDPTRRAVEVRLGIANPDYEIKPGLFVQADLYPAPQEALTLDRSTLLGFENQRYVFVNDKNHAKRVAVDVRQIDAERVEVIDGLHEGDEVLFGPNLPFLVDGAPVSLQEKPRAVISQAEKNIGVATSTVTSPKVH